MRQRRWSRIVSESARVPMGALVRLVCRPSWYTGNALREPAPAYACLYLSISAHSASPAPLSVTCPPTDSRISYSGPRASPAIDRSSLVPTWRWMTPFAPRARSGLLARRSFPGLSPSSARREGPAPWHYVPGSLMVPWAIYTSCPATIGWGWLYHAARSNTVCPHH